MKRCRRRLQPVQSLLSAELILVSCRTDLWLTSYTFCSVMKLLSEMASTCRSVRVSDCILAWDLRGVLFRCFEFVDDSWFLFLPPNFSFYVGVTAAHTAARRLQRFLYHNIFNCFKFAKQLNNWKWDSFTERHKDEQNIFSLIYSSLSQSIFYLPEF